VSGKHSKPRPQPVVSELLYTTQPPWLTAHLPLPVQTCRIQSQPLPTKGTRAILFRLQTAASLGRPELSSRGGGGSGRSRSRPGLQHNGPRMHIAIGCPVPRPSRNQGRVPSTMSRYLEEWRLKQLRHVSGLGLVHLLLSHASGRGTGFESQPPSWRGRIT